MVSVIVPVYNKAKYLKKCLSSVQTQTYSDLEIVIIDDYSTDMSYTICEDISKEDSRIELYRNKSNLGLIASRFEGIRRAKGEWIFFIDADDWIEPEAIERLVGAADEFDVDMVQLRHRRVFSKLPIKYYDNYDETLINQKIEGEEFISLSKYIAIDSKISPACWGKLYKRSILQEIDVIKFDQFWGEDQIFNIHYLRYARSMTFVDYVGYNYRWGGETSRYKYSMLSEFKNVHFIKRTMGQNIELINEELKKLLFYHVRQLIQELGWTKEAVIHVINEELRDPLWEKVGLDCSAEDIVEKEIATIQKNPIKYIVKQLLH